MPHVESSEPERLCYVASYADGARGKVVRTTPGRYLRRTYPGLSAKQVQYWAGEHKRSLCNFSLHLARTPDDIVRVYDVGPDSCMKGMRCVAVYGAGDLAVGYVERGGRIVARGLCWPEREVFESGWMYGDDDALERAFELAGFKPGSLDGARMLSLDDGCGRKFMPYLESPYGYEYHGTGFRLTCGGERHTSDDGYLEDMRECAECGTYICADDVYHANDGEEYCSDCIYYCEECEDHVPSSEYAGGGYCETCDSKRPKCERCDSRIGENDPSGETTRGEVRCEDCLSDHTCCEECDRWHPTRDGACPDCAEPCEAGDCPNDAMLERDRPAWATRALCEECQDEADNAESEAA